MPIERKLYAADWPAISYRIRFVRAGGCCEGCEMYTDCRAVHGEPHPVTGKVVYLQCAHWPDPDQANNAEENLHAWCALCRVRCVTTRWMRRCVREVGDDGGWCGSGCVGSASCGSRGVGLSARRFWLDGRRSDDNGRAAGAV